MQKLLGDPASSPMSAWRWLVPMLAVTAVIGLSGAWSTYREFNLQRDQAGARVQSVATLRAAQVETWLDRQIGIARFLDDSAALASLFLRWQDGRDAGAGMQLMQRSIDFRKANDEDTVFLIDANSRVLAQEHALDTPLADELKQAISQAFSRRDSVHTPIYRQDGSRIPLRMDIVVPLLETGSPVRGAIVLRIDPNRTLYPLLATWPVPSETGETVLWRETGDELTALSQVRWQPDSVGHLVRPLAPFNGLIGPARDDVLFGERAFDLIDYRGAAVLASALPIRGTNWLLVSKLDLDEVDAPTWSQARWTLRATLAVLAGMGLAVRLWLQRLALAEGRRDRQAHQERLKTLGMLEAITRSTTDAIYAKDLEGRFIFLNQASAALSGRSAGEMTGRTSIELFGARLGAQTAANDQQVMRDARPVVFEETVHTANGESFFLSTKGPLFNAEGKLIGLVGVSRDVTAARDSERALRDREAHYRSVVSVLSEGILVTDPKGGVISCNAAAEKILNIMQAEWQNASIVPPRWTAFHLDGRPMPLAETPAGRVLGGEPAVQEVLIAMVNDAGQKHVFSVNSAPVVSPDTGATLAVVSSFSDVTDKIALERDLARNRDELEALVAERTAALQAANLALDTTARFNRTIIDSIPGRVAYWDLERRCRFMNRTHAEWLGSTPESMLGRPAAEVFGDLYEGQIRPRLDAAIAGKPQHLERELRQPDNSSYVHQVHAIPERDANGDVRGVLVMSFDITDLKKAQQALSVTNAALEVSRDRAETASRSKSAFLANMSHEIRTPMNVVIGLTHLLKRDARDPTQRDRLRKIGEAAGHLLQIINDILDLSKIEAGKLTLEDEVFSLKDTLASVTAMLQDSAAKKRLALIVEVDALPESVRGDSTRLSQMLINLLSNAVKFTDAGWIRLRGEVVREEATRLQLRFEVQDTGVGIAVHHQSELFNAFEQADSSTARRYGGTGLGLALIRHLALAMGGEAGLASESGTGSTFWITAWFGRVDAGVDGGVNDGSVIPIYGERSAISRAMPLPRLSLNEGLERLRHGHAGMRVLLAEDNPVNQEVAEDLLRLASLVVETAENGLVAVEKIRERPFDLVLMDVQMPLKDGLEATQLIRAHGHTLPIIAMTANAFLEDRAACLDAGMNDHVGKPVNPSVLYETLLRWLPAATAPLPMVSPAPLPEPVMPTPRKVSLLDGLAETDGIDLQIALQNVGGREQVLLRVLRRFVDTYRDGQPALLSPVRAEAQTVAQWKAIAHSLEGATAAIAATSLYGSVLDFKRELEKPFSPGLAHQARALNDSLWRLTQSLAALVGAG